jgi:hypothetical protein
MKGARGQGPGIRGQGSVSARTVKQALRDLGPAPSETVADHLQVKTYRERYQVNQILADLAKGGQAKRVEAEGCVIYCLEDQPGGRGGVQQKLWEFARLRYQKGQPFGVAEAARLAECAHDYTKKYCRWLWGQGYLALSARGRAGAPVYQVVGGREHEAAPHWNRRAEKRKRTAGGDACATTPPAALPPQVHRLEALKVHRLEACATSDKARLDAALEDFGRALVEIAGSIGRAWGIIRKMKGEILDVSRPQAGTPAPPEDGHGTESHH